METVIKEKKIDHGKNVRLARTWKKMSQTNLAERLNLHQTEISALESKESIDDKLLEQIAIAMDVPVDFLKSFDAEETINSYIVHDVTMNQTEHTKGIMNAQQNVQRQEVSNFPVEKFTECFDKVIALSEENAVLKYKLEQFEKNRK